MIKVCDFIHDDNKTKEELLENIEIKKTSFKDAYKIIQILHKCFGIENEQEALRQLLYSKADLDNSVKLVDKRDGTIYGILIFSDYDITYGSPLQSYNYDLWDYLSRIKKQLNGYAFILDKRLRGTNFHKDMLMFNIDYIKQYDLIWLAVEHTLNTDNYWKRFGFEEILSIDEAKFYVKSFDKKRMLEIFILKTLSENYEKDYNK